MGTPAQWRMIDQELITVYLPAVTAQTRRMGTLPSELISPREERRTRGSDWMRIPPTRSPSTRALTTRSSMTRSPTLPMVVSNEIQLNGAHADGALQLQNPNISNKVRCTLALAVTCTLPHSAHCLTPNKHHLGTRQCSSLLKYNHTCVSCVLEQSISHQARVAKFYQVSAYWLQTEVVPRKYIHQPSTTLEPSTTLVHGDSHRR